MFGSEFTLTGGTLSALGTYNEYVLDSHVTLRNSYFGFPVPSVINACKDGALSISVQANGLYSDLNFSALMRDTANPANIYYGRGECQLIMVEGCFASDLDQDQVPDNLDVDSDKWSSGHSRSFI